MAHRTKGNVQFVGAFSGINDMVDEVKLAPEMVRASIGGYFTEQNEFKRLGGKLMNSNTTYNGRIMDIHQLRFDDVDVVVFHSSNQVMYDTNMRTLTTSASSFYPLGPFL